MEAQDGHGLPTIIDTRLKQALLLTPFVTVVTASVQFPFLTMQPLAGKLRWIRPQDIQSLSERAYIKFRFDAD